MQSTIRTEAEIIGEIYRKKIKCVDDPQKKEQVKRIIKEEIWPLQKFTDKSTIEEIDLDKEGTFLDIILCALNEEDMGRIEKLKFWMRYGNLVAEVLKTDKASASNNLKLSVKKGKLTFFFGNMTFNQFILKVSTHDRICFVFTPSIIMEI